jgi:ferredoxin
MEDIESFRAIHIEGNYPYKPLKENRTPVGDSKCVQCGLCEKGCPVEAIDKTDFRNTNSDLCIFCGHCINVCPTGARDIKEASYLEFMKKLETMTSERKEIEVFY